MLAAAVRIRVEDNRRKMGGELTVYWMKHGRFPEITEDGCIKVSLCLMFLVPFKILIILYAFTNPIDQETLPTCSLVNIYIPAFDISSNSTTTKENHTIYFDLKLRNEELLNGIYYDPLNLTFSYSAVDFQNKSATLSANANFTFPGFYQGYRKTAHRRGLAETHPVLVVAEERRSMAEEGYSDDGLVMNSLAILRIELRTALKFKSMFGKSRRHRLRLGAKVEINEGGQMVGNKGIELTADQFSAAIRSFGGYYVPMIVFSTAFMLAFI